MSKKINKTPRRLLTATMSLALLISLSSCSGATNTVGKLNSKEVYAEAGKYSVTNGELWNELKWDSTALLEEQINNVVLNKQIKKITLVMNNNYSSLSDDDKKLLNVASEDEYKELYGLYSTRLADYVVQDIYNLNYSNDSYWDNIELIDETTIKITEKKYVDEIYTTYQKDSVGETSYAELVENASEEDTSNYILIAKDLCDLYYPLYAEELLAYEKLNEEIVEAAEDDDDEDDDKIGYFGNTEYVSKFKSEYTNTFDLNMVMIRFTSSEEFNDTLRAFGLKIYNKKYYFIKDNSEAGYEDYLDSQDRMSYEDYIDYYDDFLNTSLNKENGVEELSGEVLLELFIHIYNYVYGGYRPILETNHPFSYEDINDLRANTFRIISAYSTNPKSEYEKAVNLLNQNNSEETTFTSEELNDVSASFKTYAYDTLSLVDEDGNEDMTSRYSTSTESANSGYYIMYKFGEQIDAIKDETLKSYEEFYNPDLTTYEVLDFIMDKEKNEGLEDILVELLTKDKITENVISSYLTEELEDVKVKIYNESLEISYSNTHSDYSKTLKKASNSNILASITYDGKTWNLNIKADENDKKSLVYPGTSTPIGAYDHLEKQMGATVAIDILSNKIVKNSKAFKEVKKDKDIVTYYEDYLEALLVNFANDGYASSGYPSTIGKYNFLMLYFHTANIKDIINNTYLVQHASAQLLTNYGDQSLSEFFKTYTDLAYDGYFSLSGTRLVVYMDIDDDNEADDINLEDQDSWNYNEVVFEGKNVTMEYVAKSLIYDVYNKISASNTDHSTKLTELVDEINNSARVVYEDNPIVPENNWAKYRKLGLKVKTEEFTTTNSDLSIDFNLKQRLYDYARGYSEDENGNKTKTYQYFLNDTIPTLYIEPLTQDSISDTNDDIVATKDGFNLILVTKGDSRASAKWTLEDNNDNLLTDIKIKYNEEFINIENVYNEEDKLNVNQIQLYVLDYAINGANTLLPSSIASAVTTFLEPVVTRFTSAETQRIILLNFIKATADIEDTVELYNVVTFKNEAYNGENGYFANAIEINQNIADNYNYLYNDTTGTSDIYPDWWENLKEQVAQFLVNEEVSE
ncbi:MAG: hypothetical protein IJA65_01310 [Acholeplasmatales bacterium]|nr:hypothetical protein [Acholeplasmatales bacterium]